MESLGTCQCPNLGSRWKLESRPGSTNQISTAALGVDIRKTEATVVRREEHLGFSLNGPRDRNVTRNGKEYQTMSGQNEDRIRTGVENFQNHEPKNR